MLGPIWRVRGFFWGGVFGAWKKNKSVFDTEPPSFCNSAFLMKKKLFLASSNPHFGPQMEITQSSTKVGDNQTYQICLTKDDKNLLVGSYKILKVFNTETNIVTKELKMNKIVSGIKLINGGKSALIAESRKWFDTVLAKNAPRLYWGSEAHI